MNTIDYPYEKNAYTLYSNALCPYAQRAVRAFKAAKVPYKLVEIDLKNKPEWFRLVNPQFKVPVLRTPDGSLLIESLVVAEFIAEQFPQTHLLPATALERAQLRLFIEIFSSRFSPFVYRTLMASSKDEQESRKESLLAGVREISKELERQWERPSGQGGPFWSNGKFGFAEIATASFVGLLVPLGHYRSVVVPKTQEYAGFNRWAEAISKDPLFTETKVEDNALNEAYKKFVAEEKQ
ncbi:hypothetical protein GGI25_004942 [Coemansia spiralis]|uniref:Glutathione S-transferase n=2 Tax=Coemansia TaxID=4863 RepID=A0A9W8FZJ1_9FUNG|nr:hypothetical protein EDC05_005167 [Coemansia umbellata]KAJ2622445.1 hypothetical protein GGI26_003308 [Coemansia sp. RSA 1358]KAJ2672899.1 hypothetical protein GGI25_004942 [Coemansia spiralis]